MNYVPGYPIADYIEIPTFYDYQFGIPSTTSCFDPQQELLWMGYGQGRVTSYFSSSLLKYTSFCLPFNSNPEIKTIYPHHERDIFILNADTLFCYNRLGTCIFKYKEVAFKNLECMFFNQQERFFLGGFNDFIFDFDFERLRTLRKFNITADQSDCILIKCSASNINIPSASPRNGILCTGSTNGKIILRDPFTLKSIQKLHPHNGSLSDIDVHGNYLATCGFSSKIGGLYLDRFLMVYDLRMMRALNPVHLAVEPSFLKFLPICSSMIGVASQSGSFQLMDTHMMAPSIFYQTQVLPGLVKNFSISENCQAIALGHDSGSLHLFTKGENILFNNFPQETLFVDEPQFDYGYIDINDDLSILSKVPISVNDEENLISDWPYNKTKPEYRPTPDTNQKLTDSTRSYHGILTYPNVFDMKRNQIFYNDCQEKLKELEKKSSETHISLDKMEKFKPIKPISKESNEQLNS